MICPFCSVDDSRPHAYLGPITRHRCYGCGKTFRAPTVKQDSRVPRVLVLDIETAPMRVFVWGLWKQRINPDNIISDYYILCWATKWLSRDEIISEVLTPAEAIAGNDKRILSGIWELLNEADIIIAHNGQRFDLRKLNARFLLYDMPPPMPYQVVDTLKKAQKKFGMSSHKQSYITKYLGLREKLDTDFNLWIRCLGGEQEALDYMVEYCRGDIVGLEGIYLKIQSWVDSHPNMAIYAEAETQTCPSCGHEDLSWEGFYTTSAGRYRAFRCAKCGGIGRSRFNDLSKQQKSVLLLPTAR